VRSEAERGARTPGAPGRRSRSGSARLPAVREPPTLFCQDLPHAQGLQALLTDDLQQTVVLAFQTPEAFGFGDARVSVAFLSEVERCGAATEITAELLYGLFALLSVLEEGNDLLFGERFLLS
jgi:hypothetical protein